MTGTRGIILALALAGPIALMAPVQANTFVVSSRREADGPRRRNIVEASEPSPAFWHESTRKGKGEKKRAASGRRAKGWG